MFSGPCANLLLFFIADIKSITPNIVTTSSLLLCFIAAFLISKGTMTCLIVGSVLVQLVFVLDCLDGQLARYRKQSSNFGAWYDRVTDRVKDFLIYFSIAYGHYAIYQDWKIWPLGMTSLFFIYLLDYYVNQDVKLETKDQKTSEYQNTSTSAHQNINTTSSILNSFFALGKNVYNLCPILRFKIGEQYLLISIFLLFNQTRLLFLIVISLGFLYSIYWPFAQYYGKKPG